MVFNGFQSILKIFSILIFLSTFVSLPSIILADATNDEPEHSPKDVLEYSKRDGRFLSTIFNVISTKFASEPARMLGSGIAKLSTAEVPISADQEGLVLPEDGDLNQVSLIEQAARPAGAASSAIHQQPSSNRTKEQISGEEAINAAASLALQALNKTITNGTLTLEEQMLYKLFIKGKDFLTREDSPLRQIFPFNPYIAYGPFLTIPLWVLMGMYIKLLKKTKEFYSSAYRINFYKDKPLGLKGYYLHPAYYPVERVPLLGAVQYEKEEGYGKPTYGDGYKHSYGGHDNGVRHEDFPVENTYNLPPDIPLYADDDTFLPPLPDGIDEEYFKRRGGFAALRRRIGPAARSDHAKRVSKPSSSVSSAGPKMEVRVDPTEPGQRRRRRNEQTFSRRIGIPVIDNQGSNFGVKNPSNLPWAYERKRVYSTTAAPGLPLQSLFNTAQPGRDLQPTTWRPSLLIRRKTAKRTTD